MRTLILFLVVAWSLQAADPAPREATLHELKGEVLVGEGKPPAKEEKAAAQQKINDKQYVRTGKDGYAELKFGSGAATRMGPMSVFRFAAEKNEFILDRGEGLFVFPKGKGGATIATPSFSAGILGTTVFVRVNTSGTEYLCLEGKCSIGPHTLVPGERLMVSASQQAYAAPKTTFKGDDFLKRNKLVKEFNEPLSSLGLIKEALKIQ